MADIMCSNDIMIGSASSVTIEAIACELDIICGYYEENQCEFYDYLNHNNIVFGIGNFRNIQPENFSALINKGIATFNKNSTEKLIDGNQPMRLINTFNELIHE